MSQINFAQIYTAATDEEILSMRTMDAADAHVLLGEIASRVGQSDAVKALAAKTEVPVNADRELVKADLLKMSDKEYVALVRSFNFQPQGGNKRLQLSAAETSGMAAGWLAEAWGQSKTLTVIGSVVSCGIWCAAGAIADAL